MGNSFSQTNKFKKEFSFIEINHKMETFSVYLKHAINIV